MRELYDHFENFQKKNFNWREFSKSPWPFESFHSIFNLKTVLISQKIGQSKFGVSNSASKNWGSHEGYLTLGGKLKGFEVYWTHLF